MKITFDRERVLHAFQSVASVVPTRSPKAILKNVKLDAADNQLVVSATDMEVGIRIEVGDIEVEAGGSVLVPVDRFGSILRESTDEKLRIETTDKGISVRGDRSRFSLPSENPEEFPVVASFEEEKFHEIPIRLFREMIRRTLFATDTESSRYALGGVLLEMEAEKITAVGTDGRRLAKMEGPARAVNGHGSGDTMTIVPTRAMQLMERTTSDGDTEVQIAARANDILVKTPNTTIYARLVEGRFPKWRDVFPKRTSAVQIEMTVGPLYSALRQAAVVVSDDSRGVDFKFGDGTLMLSASTSDLGQSEVELPIPYNGESIIVTLDHRYVADFLKVLDAERTFTFEIESPDAAALCSTDDGYGYVIMPLARDR
ncbi:MAG: DNA polymerase III subunit beta [Pirellulaceae bacterium]